MVDRDINRFHTTEYWEHFFDENTKIYLDFVTMLDGSKILVVKSEPLNQTYDRPIFFFAGWFSQILSWQHMTRYMSKFTTIYFIESREKASSILPNTNVDLSVQQFAKDLDFIFRKLDVNINNSIFIASSMGATTLFELYATTDWDPHMTFMVGPNPHFEYPKYLVKFILLLPVFFYKIGKPVLIWYIKKFRLDVENEPEQAERYETILEDMIPWRLKKSGRQCLEYSAWPLLSKIDQKIVLIGAESDKLHTAEITKKIKEELPNGEYRDFESNKRAHSIELADYIIKKAL